jgi:polysaccharide chain length determinant protein (PEP-CTERM system associated)
MESARTFVAQQVATYEVQLRQAERRRAEFQARYIDVLPSDALGGISRLEAARARLQQVQGELTDARIRRDVIQSQINAVPAQIAAETTMGGGGGDGRFAEAERALRELRLRFTDEHPDVISARSILAELRASGGGSARAATPPRAPATARPGQSNPLLEQLRVRLVDVDGQIGSLQRQETTGRAEVTRLDAVARGEPELQAQFLNLDRDYNVLRRNYEELLARRESLQIAGAARTNSDRLRLEVVDPPVIPIRPVAPNRPLLVSAVLLAGIGAGVLLALVLAWQDRSFYTLHDLRAVGLPVLGGISGPQARPAIGPRLAFGLGLVTLPVGYGAMLAGLPGQVARLLA